MSVIVDVDMAESDGSEARGLTMIDVRPAVVWPTVLGVAAMSVM